MKRRLYFILPDTQLARTVHNELLLARVPEKRMHVIADGRVDLILHFRLERCSGPMALGDLAYFVGLTAVFLVLNALWLEGRMY